MNFNFEIGFDRIRLVKWLMNHRTRVANKMSVLGNDLAIRGRRHDNSYTGDTESELFIKAKTSKDINNRMRYGLMVQNLHEGSNDYLPGYHENGLSDMNLVQLIELICDNMAALEERISNPNNGDTEVKLNPEDYYDAALERIPEDTPDIVKDMIRNTVDYIVDKNAVIKGMIEKREALRRGETTKKQTI